MALRQKMPDALHGEQTTVPGGGGVTQTICPPRKNDSLDRLGHFQLNRTPSDAIVLWATGASTSNDARTASSPARSG